MAKAKKKTTWTVSHQVKGVARLAIRGAYPRQWVYVSSDWHWDNPKCDRDRLKADLDRAKRLHAPVLCFGDLFCAMQGKYDSRKSKDDVRDEHQTSHYLDALVDTAAKWLHPYRDIIALVSDGNHETAIRNHHETCLLSRLTDRLRREGSPVIKGGYAGWIYVTVEQSGTKVRGSSASHRIYYHHGSGGGSAVTRGVGEFARLADFIDADTYICGHVHQRTHVEASRQRLNVYGKPITKPVLYIRTSTFKDEFGTDGWHVEKGRGPRPLGGYWLLFQWSESKEVADRLIVSVHDQPQEE